MVLGSTLATHNLPYIRPQASLEACLLVLAGIPAALPLLALVCMVTMLDQLPIRHITERVQKGRRLRRSGCRLDGRLVLALTDSSSHIERFVWFYLKGWVHQSFCGRTKPMGEKWSKCCLHSLMGVGPTKLGGAIYIYIYIYI